jgi:hypothetical protein
VATERGVREHVHCAAIYALLCVLLTASTASAENRWPDERQAGLLLCHADFTLAPHQPLLDELSQLQQDLGTLLGAEAPREHVHFFLFKEKETYQAYLKQHFPRVPYRRALYIKARGPGMVFAFQGMDFEVDVRHECTHALLHAWLPSIPLWLDEGLAEYFEVHRSQRARQHPNHVLVQTALKIGQKPRLEELESLTSVEAMGRDEYRDAWAWIHFLLNGPKEGHDELLRYLTDLQDGSDPGPLSSRLRRRIPDLHRKLAEHFQP